MKNKPRNLVGPQVRRLRSSEGLSQPALAAQCQIIGWDVGRDAIAKIEGQIRWVADSELIFLARALRCDPMDLFPPDVQTIFRGSNRTR
jgi:transcriptional regulator with XRE-family HTH domain